MGDKESPLLQIDPKCLQDALRSFFQPIKTDDPRVDFYTMYKREATEYDTDYVRKYDEDLNTTLIFAGLFSAVNSAFVIDFHSNLRPNPNEQSAALLRAILLTLNQSATPGETPAVPPVREDPPSEIVTATSLMYASLLISLLAAFVAMLGKQWLNRYLRNSGRSTIERCGDRQRKCDGLEKWPLHLFVESLPVMLQAALLLLACGLCRRMSSVNASVAHTLISFTGLGVVFYVAIVIAGTSSYACPFQTPASIVFRGLWKKVRRRTVSSIFRYERVLSWTHRTWDRRVRSLFRRQSPTTIPLENIRVQRPESEPMLDNAPRPEPLSTPDDASQPESSSTLDSAFRPEPWLKPKELGIIRRTNTSDARCVSWILRNITDQEALDAAIRLAGVIRWFEDGANVDFPYDLIVCTFEACFDSTRTLYLGSRDKAYYSARAMMWIHALAECKSEEFASMFPLPDAEYTTTTPDPDLRHLLRANSVADDAEFYIGELLEINPGHTPPHSQWVSNLLLHCSWANRTRLDYERILYSIPRTHEIKTTIPLDATLNRLLAWCTFLGSAVNGEALKVQDKSDRMEPILDQLSKAVPSAINGTHTQREFILYMLRDLVKLENRPERLTEIAYDWCSMICENRQSLRDWKRLLPVCLEVGFRHLDFQGQYIVAAITHTEHHRELVDVVFGSRESEVIADLLHAWTAEGGYCEPAHTLLGFCAENLVFLHHLVPFSPRLRRLAIRSVELIGYEGFEGVGMEMFVEFLNHLHVTAEDMDDEPRWARLLLNTIKFSRRTQRLSHQYWEFLVEFTVWGSQSLELGLVHSMRIINSLTGAMEWSKLEFWMGIVWMLLSQKAIVMAEGELSNSMVLLFRQRPGAAQKLNRQMDWWDRGRGSDVLGSFKRASKQAHGKAQRDALPISSTDEQTERFAYAPPPVSSQPSGGNEFRELLPF